MRHKKYKLREYCLICNIKIKPDRSNMCPFCGGTFCEKHYNVHNHNCQGDHKNTGNVGGTKPTADSLPYI